MIALNTDSDIFPSSPLILHGGCRKVHSLAFEALQFRNEAKFRVCETNLGSAYNGPLMSPKLVQFGPLGSPRTRLWCSLVRSAPRTRL